MKNSGRNLLVLLAILLFPVVFWLLITRGHNHFRRLPIIGSYEVSQKGDTVYHTVPAFSFINQEGKTISETELKGRIYVANFFFATCKTICPKMNEQIRRVQGAFQGDTSLRILSFTVDPANDTVAALAAYAEKMGADNKVWWFLTGDKDSIYSLARDGFLVPAAEGKGPQDFFHSQDLILVDKERHIRGIYDGGEPAEVDTLIDEIKVLEREYFEKK